jgi:hypothetical protein
MKRKYFEKLLGNDSSLYAQEGFNKDGSPNINHTKKSAFLAGANWAIDTLTKEITEMIQKK